MWGGDAIVDPESENFKLVDFNDWPSFERVRAPAAAGDRPARARFAGHAHRIKGRQQITLMKAKKNNLPSITTPVPGPHSRAIFDNEERYLAPGRQRISSLAGVAFDHGEGATLTDVDGNVYLDFFAGVAVASLGHGHPVLSKVLADQASRLMVGTFATPERAARLQDACRGRAAAA